MEYAKGKTQRWLFKCDCGKESIVNKGSVVGGITKSCGCLSKKHFNDLTGKEINGNLLLRLTGKNHHKCWIYEVKCNCGKIFSAEGNDISSGKIKSCGCRWNSDTLKNAKYEESIMNSLYSQLSTRSGKRGHSFSLTKDEHHKLIQQNCYYCGISPNQMKRMNKGRMLLHGIDRVNNDEGYHFFNCVTACRTCNQAKHMLKLEVFAEWIQRISNHKTEKKGIWKNE